MKNRYMQPDWPSETDTQKLICHETKRATTDPRPRMKSSHRGASTGVWVQAPFLFFGELFLKNRGASVSRIFLGSPAAVFVLENRVD